MVGKWTYNEAGKENWNADEEFHTKEEAIEAGRKYFTEPDGYLDNEGEPYEVGCFDVGLISDPYIKVRAWNVIDSVTEDVGEECGEFSDGWLDKVSKEDQNLLSIMLTETFKEWMSQTNNKPRFFTINEIESIDLE